MSSHCVNTAPLTKMPGDNPRLLMALPCGKTGDSIASPIGRGKSHIGSRTDMPLQEHICRNDDCYFKNLSNSRRAVILMGDGPGMTADSSHRA